MLTPQTNNFEYIQVDILFDEDKGFWSAVYEIIAATKRPIIMTCSGEQHMLTFH